MERAWFKSNKPNGSNVKTNKMLPKGYLYHFVRVNDLDKEVPSMDCVSIVKEFPYIIPEDLPWFPPEREIAFGVDLDLNTKPISILPYRMAPAELKELKLQMKYLLYKGFT